MLFSTLSTVAPHPPDPQLCEETPEILKLETVLSGKVHISCLSTALQILGKKTSERERGGALTLKSGTVAITAALVVFISSA